MKLGAAAGVLLALTGACGRVAFDTHRGDGGSAGEIDAAGDGAAVDTGSAGPRWARQFGGSARGVALTGRLGHVAAAQQFSTSFAVDGGPALAGAGFTSTALVRYDAGGTFVDGRVFDNSGFCDIRDALYDGDVLVLGGFSQGTAMPALGTCSISASRQNPIVIRIDAADNETLTTRWVASGANAQLWFMARYDSGQLAVSGVYSDTLMLDTALPMAQADPNAFIARPFDGMPATAQWSHGMPATTVTYAGPIAAAATRAFMLGSFAGTPTILGTALTSAGGVDNYLARIDEDGTVVFVRAIGSAQSEADFGNDASVIALPDGSVMVGLYAPGDVTYDAQLFPASGGVGLVLHIDGTGTLIRGLRLPSPPALVNIGDRVFAAFDVNAPFLAGSITHTPAGEDGLVVELVDGLPAQVVGVVGGSGDQGIDEAAVTADDAIAISGPATGMFQFGSSTFDAPTEIRYIASLGL